MSLDDQSCDRLKPFFDRFFAKTSTPIDRYERTVIPARRLLQLQDLLVTELADAQDPALNADLEQLILTTNQALRTDQQLCFFGD